MCNKESLYLLDLENAWQELNMAIGLWNLKYPALNILFTAYCEGRVYYLLIFIKYYQVQFHNVTHLPLLFQKIRRKLSIANLEFVPHGRVTDDRSSR